MFHYNIDMKIHDREKKLMLRCMAADKMINSEVKSKIDYSSE